MGLVGSKSARQTMIVAYRSGVGVGGCVNDTIGVASGGIGWRGVVPDWT